MDTCTLDLDDAVITYDVHGPDPAPGDRPLLAIGQPMDATGFRALAAQLPQRRVVAYDPRGIGRSTRRDGRTDHDPHVQAADVHALIGAIGGPVDLLASSGGAVTALALVAAHPGDVRVLVAHEPPLIGELPDAGAARRAWDGVREAYDARGSGAGMAAFIALTSWSGEFTDEYFAAGSPDPAQFGLSDADDGSRDDPLLSGRSDPVFSHVPDAAALAAAPTRVLIAVGEESGDTLTARTARALAARLGRPAVRFLSHHGGFAGGEFGHQGDPAGFAARLCAVLGGGG
ncbi:MULTISPECIES: alpha/beta fold hydrolase [Pseudonocardia]|uniref:Hydrolase n=2 Tax=Pseudonocardia TaxID=1847 RepID=A0ABQ0RW10_9PSEU|nr:MULTISPECIES: alpha/beta hydrolase [Pseudonocardia]OSY39423.1 putative hydrolase [Pseudonocardia autotrophica]TDN75339.1 pimeloyl-ACP methyl ester carboxylesterase [Pseudonocardia autotrophica]BBF99285.1 hydrolase [Pseudonocardia autotrophica]GEC24831.1 hydrolase [Pseudonocardia saturnea]